MSSVSGAHLSLVIAMFTAAPLHTQAPTRQSVPATSQTEHSDGKGDVTSLSDSTSLQIIEKVQPVYPIDAETTALQGQVVLKVLVSETGVVEAVDVVNGNETLAQAAVGAVKGWKFQPFVMNGNPTKVYATIPFDFIFRDKPPDTDSPSPAGAVPATGQTQRVVWVRGDIEAKLVLEKVRPEYPYVAKMGRIQGNVNLRVVIGSDGAVRYLRFLSGHPLLKQSAVDAVSRWRYRPYLLNGEPTEVQTVITVMYTLSGGKPHI